MKIYAGENDSDVYIKQLPEYAYSSEGAKQILAAYVLIFKLIFKTDTKVFFIPPLLLSEEQPE